MAVHYRLGILFLSFLLLAGCSSPTAPPVEKPAVSQQTDQSTAASPVKAAPAPEEVQKPAAASTAPKPKDKPRPPAPSVVASPAPLQDAVSPRIADNLSAPPPAPVPVPVPVPITPIPVPPPIPSPPTIRKVTIPEGTLIAVRTVDVIDSATAKLGQTFQAVLDAPVSVGDETLAPRGGTVDLRLTHVESAGSLKGQSKVSLELERLVVAGKSYTVASNVYEKQAESQSSQTLKRTGIGAGIGAAIGAIVGGGKGAAIGAGVGGGTGVAIEATGKGPQVHIDSESRLEFRLERPLDVTLESSPSDSTSSKDSTGPRVLTPRAINNDNAAHDLFGK